MKCQKCIDKWGQEPSLWGDSIEELEAYDEHIKEHRNERNTETDSCRQIK